jgi:hypothetical protein
MEVDDLDAAYAQVLAESWPLSGSMQEQPWELWDFRVKSPDGHSIRHTTA